MTDSQIERIIKDRLSEKRYRHTLGCAEVACRLAARWGESEVDARRAALLHDIAKEMPYERQLQLVSEHGVLLSETQKLKSVIHAFAGAVCAEVEFGEPARICDAVRWHTTARKGMSLLEKVIWLADLTEPRRNFDGVDKIRDLAFQDMRRALILGFDITLSHLVSRGQAIDTNMVEARNFELLAEN